MYRLNRSRFDNGYPRSIWDRMPTADHMDPIFLI